MDISGVGKISFIARSLNRKRESWGRKALIGKTNDVVRKELLINTSQRRAFQAFAEQMDLWWPRMHHIGKSEMMSGRPAPACVPILEPADATRRAGAGRGLRKAETGKHEETTLQPWCLEEECNHLCFIESPLFF